MWDCWDILSQRGFPGKDWWAGKRGMKTDCNGATTELFFRRSYNRLFAGHGLEGVGGVCSQSMTVTIMD